MPGRARDSRGSGRDSGTNTPEPFARWDRATSSWRTSELSLLGDSTPFSGRWPTSGTMRSGVCTAQPTWAPRTAGTGPGFWPTPKASDVNQDRRTDASAFREKDRPNSGSSLAIDSRMWSTPRAEDGERGQASQHDGLMEDVRDWATPSTRDWKDTPGMATTGTNPDGSTRQRLDQLPRQAVAKAWGTPVAADAVGSTGGNMGKSLRTDVRDWSTPTSNDAKNGSLPPSQMDRNGLAGEVAPWAGQTPSQSADTTAPSGSSPAKPLRRGLNPCFGLWLMGYPVEWLDSVVSATRSSRRVRSRSSDGSPNSKDSE